MINATLYVQDFNGDYEKFFAVDMAEVPRIGEHITYGETDGIHYPGRLKLRELSPLKIIHVSRVICDCTDTPYEQHINLYLRSDPI